MTEPSWAPLVDGEAAKAYWRALESFVQQQWRTAKVFPAKENVFRALNTAPVSGVKVVILGQVRQHLICTRLNILRKIHSLQVGRCVESLVHPVEHLSPESSAAPAQASAMTSHLNVMQDPYHGAGQAEGFCFSVPKTQPLPSSLRNIYKEIAEDIGCQVPKHGHLQHWAGQGTLLINACLTVRVRAHLSLCMAKLPCHAQLFLRLEQL